MNEQAHAAVLLTALACAAIICGCSVAQHEPRQAQPAGGGAAMAGEPDNEFARANPGYRQQAGDFYAKEYLPKAVQQLASAAELTDGQAAAARKILRTFIDCWLERYVAGDGCISRVDLDWCLAGMDGRFSGELSPKVFAKYLQWRKDETGASNAMAFLMNPRFTIQPLDASSQACSRLARGRGRFHR